ncbi:unnamed protein product [Bursaphelenchus xylophilus]|uniref:(pine wood nematode) hypothetical protein n=1 Tax=Bursaphelenchus xylophilus TaxID=6326 RepID=A0A1I7S4V1_BURXY|nr:unnamed protein product [Bursaphelenchus xylophilus]CAG9117395.1 unnamed protein product [Bursaphelenchus xylophilus]
MNPLLWVVFVVVLYILLNLKALWKAIQERRHIVKCLEPMEGPEALPLIGVAHKLNPDSVLMTYIMEYFFRSHTDALNSNGVMKLWLGPKPIVMLYKPETVRPILDSHVFVQKPNDYDFLKEWLGEGLLTSSNPKWHSRRKMLTPAFHFSILENFMNCFNEQASVLVQKLDNYAKSGYPFDIYPHLKAIALDVICEAAMGVQMGSQTGKNMEYVRSVKILCESLWLRIRSPWLWPALPWNLLGYGPKCRDALKVVKGFSEKIIQERRREFQERNNNKQENERPAFLDILLGMESAKCLTDEDIREEVDTFMFEGHDTVSNTLSFLLFMISDQANLHFQDKIYEELREIFADNPDRHITTADLGKMKYLEQCIKEGMRMAPVVPMIGRIALEDIPIGDLVVPKGVAVLVTPFLVHRNRTLWKNPNEFDPSHFDPEECRKRHPFAYIPFSAGARNCIGQKFAMNQLKVVLAHLFRRFKFIGAVHEVENRGLPELVMKPNKGCVLRVEVVN